MIGQVEDYRKAIQGSTFKYLENELKSVYYGETIDFYTTKGFVGFKMVVDSNDVFALHDALDSEMIKWNSSGVMILKDFTSEPTAVSGGLHFRNNKLYIGLEET